MLVPGILKEFCQNTSIHGLKSIVDAKSSLIKRIAWFVIFVISILYAGVQLKGNVDSKLTLSMWQKIVQIRIKLSIVNFDQWGFQLLTRFDFKGV